MEKMASAWKTSEAVFVMVVGLLLGTVFTFGMNYWNAPVAREEAVPVTAVYDYCIGSFEVGEQIILRFEDHEQLTIDGCCSTKALREQIKALEPGDQISALVHPNADTILELTVGGEVLMEFDASVEELAGEKIGFRYLGVFLYAMAIFAAACLILNKIKR